MGELIPFQKRSKVVTLEDAMRRIEDQTRELCWKLQMIERMQMLEWQRMTNPTPIERFLKWLRLT